MATEILPTSTCPSNDELRSLVRGRLPDRRQSDLTEHLEECASCQERIEAVALEGDKSFSGVVLGVNRSQPPRDSAYWTAIQKTESDLTAEYLSSSSVEVSLNFLKPSTVPEHLGRLGSFEIIRVIGRGGMGVVLHGFDSSLQRDVAIKILDPQLANDPVAFQRFCREARLAASVTHDNLVAVYQVDQDPESKLPYLVMQLVNGETLEQRLMRVGTLPVAEAVRMARDAALGLAAAHEKGLIHRDIKPGNILIEALTDKCKLTDFGLARAVEDMKLTRTGFVAGTPLYMAPEQAKGETVDARADLFSLGTVLYESLAGRPPFDGKTPLIVLKQVSDDHPVSLRKLNPDVPPWLEETIDRLLAKKPADRFQTAAEVAEVFSNQYQCLNTSSPANEQACVIAQSSSLLRKAKRGSRVAAAILFGIPFLSGALVSAVAMFTFLPPREIRVEVPVPAISEPSSTNAVVAADPAKNTGPDEAIPLKSHSGAICSVSAAIDSKVVDGKVTETRLVAWGQEDGTAELWDMINKNRLDTFQAHQGPIWAAEISPDGKMLVTASDDGTVKVWDITKAAKLIRTLDHKSSVRSAALNSSGDHLVTGDRLGIVRVWNLADAEATKPILELEHGGTINAVAFHRNSLMIASASTNKTAVLWDVTTGRRRGTLEGHKGSVYSLSFSPEGDALATVSWDKTIRVWDTQTAQMIGEPIDAHDEGIWSVSFACCGKRLATGGQDGLVKVWNLDTRKEIARFARHKGTVHTVRFTPDAAFLLSGGRDGTMRAWSTKDLH